MKLTNNGTDCEYFGSEECPDMDGFARLWEQFIRRKRALEQALKIMCHDVTRREDPSIQYIPGEDDSDTL